jgi:hypothetical protein
MADHTFSLYIFFIMFYMTFLCTFISKQERLSGQITVDHPESGTIAKVLAIHLKLKFLRV